MISIIGLQYWRIGLILDDLQHGLRFQLKLLCFLGVMLHLFLLNYDLTLYVLRQCLYKKIINNLMCCNVTLLQCSLPITSQLKTGEGTYNRHTSNIEQCVLYTMALPFI
jgi:hypothetical protein